MNTTCKLNDINIRDPFILVHDDCYYMYGTNLKKGFDCWYSHDYEQWTKVEDILITHKEATWNTYAFWAPEVYYRDDKFYIFYTAKNDNSCRGVGVAVSGSPLGPFKDINKDPLTPEEWECLDGHIVTTEEGKSYMFYVHEWLQCETGEMIIQEISDDFSKLEGKPKVLFKASDSKWNKNHAMSVVVDGPFIIKNNDKYLMMWSSFDKEYDYCIGQAISDNLLGPYHHMDKPIQTQSGHNMCFKKINDDRLYTIYHSPNDKGKERPMIKEVLLDDNMIKFI